ncbi:helix-turn-helix domain-containing protein [Ruminococcus sp.]|uniref:helix-turn-helix domain-containing protein n=1 Tax=Ruminococcus sp. TaxID=41978 RepID=UPI00386E3427
MDTAYDKAFGQNLRRLRIEAGFTQDQLAAKLQVDGCDITRSAIAKIEVGQRHIYPDEIKKIHEILGVSYNDMFI